MQLSFSSQELLNRVRGNSVLNKISVLLNWESFRPLLQGLHKREASGAGGQEAFDALLMFKAILLGQWHSLSDPKLEEALYIRIDFILFCGLSLSDAVPDETTLCRFRNLLIDAGRLDPLLNEVNKQLQSHGLMVSQAIGAVVDATLISSAARPNKTMTIEVDVAGDAITYEDGSEPGIVCEEKDSVDPDATWVKKGKRSYFGYRSYWVTDSEDGYVRGVHTAPANQSEMNHFDAALDQVPDSIERAYADKGFSSQAHRQGLRDKKIKVAIQHRATKNKPLTKRQKQANRLISKTRYIVEQAFGTAKRLLKIGRASYMTTTKVNGQMILKAMCLNLIKAANKILAIHPLQGHVRLLQG